MAGTYDLKKSGDQFVFNLKAGNGEVILTSERYLTKAGALSGIESVRRNSAIDARYDRRKSSSGQAYFVLTALNGETIRRSETYTTTTAMEAGITSVKANGPAAGLDDRT